MPEESIPDEAEQNEDTELPKQSTDFDASVEDIVFNQTQRVFVEKRMIQDLG